MLRVIEKVLSDPIRMIPKPGVRFVPGMVVRSATLEDGTLVCDVSDGRSILGIVENECEVDELSFHRANMVKVWAQKMVFRTTRYEGKFRPGGPVYVRDGMLTADKPFENAMCVARTTGTPEDLGQLEAVWI